ncbi:hypothetical protein ACHAQJ_003112 [Trichoderma viride]
MAHKSDPEVRLDFLYDFEKKEFILRFDSDSQAAAYQTMNPEARILEGQPYNVWLPHPPGMSSLRSSSLGMAVIFKPGKAAEEWQRRTGLGDIVTFSRETGVYFKRNWSPVELERRMGSWRLSLRPPSSRSGRSNSRPRSSKGDRVFEVNVKRQSPSTTPYYT